MTLVHLRRPATLEEVDEMGDVRPVSQVPLYVFTTYCPVDWLSYDGPIKSTLGVRVRGFILRVRSVVALPFDTRFFIEWTQSGLCSASVSLTLGSAQIGIWPLLTSRTKATGHRVDAFALVSVSRVGGGQGGSEVLLRPPPPLHPVECSFRLPESKLGRILRDVR